MKPTPQKMPRTKKTQKTTRFFALILITLTALFFTTACGSDNDNNGNNAGDPVITLTYNGQTITAGLNGFGTSMPIASPLVIGTNAHVQGENGDPVLVTTSLVLNNPSGKPTTGDYALYVDGEQPDDGKPFAWMLLTGATAVGLPPALEATAGTIKVASLQEHDFLLGSADYTFTATFHDLHEDDDIAYQVSGTVKHTNKMPSE